MLKLSQVAITLFTTLSLTALAGIPAVQHQSVTIDFAGPTSSESAASPQNPFLDYRLNVRFTHGPSGKTYLVPGFFDGDGNGGGSGNVWRVRFTPDLAGTWSYAAELRYGTQVAVSLDPVAGAAQNLPEASGELDVATFDPDAPGFLKWGRLDYVGEHYLKFQNGPYFVKVGADDPEDFFGYTGFDDVTTTGKHHTFAAHDGDWRSGDPDWNGGKGKNIIGALNYLADQGINSVYIILMNIGGDGQNTHPYLKTVSLSGSTTNDNLHFDISRLAQWEIVMAHAQRRGLNLHLVLGEAEEKNKKELDNATLGVERKLYYRELAARFGHHQALQWNLNEEYDHRFPTDATQIKAWPDMIKSWAGYLQSVDAYKHPITVHQIGDPDVVWTPFLGDSRFSLTSFQFTAAKERFGAEVEEWRDRSAAAGRKIPVNMDELQYISTDNMDKRRKSNLWPTLMSGGGVEFYIGSAAFGLNDLGTYEDIFVWGGYARKFFDENLPFWEMAPRDALLTGESTTSAAGEGQVLAKDGEVYAIYYPTAKLTGTLNLASAAGKFNGRWFSPKTGLFVGTPIVLQGGAARAIPAVPGLNTDDWVLLLTKEATVPALSSLSLIDAVTQQAIPGFDPIVNGSEINLALLPTRQVDLRANVSNTLVKSVRFVVNGGTPAVDSAAPFVAGLTSLNLGLNSIVGTPFGDVNAGGAAGAHLTLAISVIDEVPPEPVYYSLSVSKTGAGQGTVSATGINCGSDCAESILENTAVTLSAAPAAGSIFLGWSGACSGSATCSVTMNGDQTVTANFALTYLVQVTKTGTGQGTVTGTGINCGSDCSESLVAGTVITLSAAAQTGSTFDGWSGTCSGTGSCVITADAARSVTASFTAVTQTPPPLSATGLTLINADTDQPIAGYAPIAPGAVISLAALPTRNLNFRADVSGPEVKSVRFGWNTKPSYKTESEAPFSLFGDTAGDYKAGTLPTGAQSFTLTPFPNTGASGTPGTVLNLNFTVTN